MIMLRYQYYYTENFSLISIIVTLNITIHDNIVLLPITHTDQIIYTYVYVHM